LHLSFEDIYSYLKGPATAEQADPLIALDKDDA